ESHSDSTLKRLVQPVFIQSMLEDMLHGGQLSCNHVDEVWPNLFLGDMYMSHDRYALWRLGITHVLNAAHERVFAHCLMGVSCSATLVLAFLMICEDLTLMEAIKAVRQHRDICPNLGFLNQLRHLDMSLGRKINGRFLNFFQMRYTLNLSRNEPASMFGFFTGAE
uniref:Dual specificity protein phosphatase n=1 Tax=Cyprinus carpio TaxID=7962 RepID=A0A8C1MYT6_CYPCA